MTRRARRSSLDLLTILAVALPAVTVALLAFVRPAQSPPWTASPRQVPLTESAVVCPAEHGSAVAIASADPRASGPVLRDGKPVPLAAGKVLAGRHGQSWRISAEDRMAPGLLALRSSTKPLSALSCPVPQADVWFAGVGAAAKHTSVLSMTNPDGGPAVADITVFGPHGLLDVPALQGLKISGHETRSIRLADTVPNSADLTLHVVVNRGRLGLAVRDHLDKLGAGPNAWDWLPATARPVTTAWLLGVPLGSGPRSLAITNPSTSEVRATWSVVTDKSVFTPTSAHEITVPAQSTVSVSLKGQPGVWDARTAADATQGLRITADTPIVATLRNFPGRDLSSTTTATAITSHAATILPAAGNVLVLAGASKNGTVTVTQRTADGRDLGAHTLTVGPDQASTVRLDKQAAIVTVDAPAGGLSAAVLSQSAAGATVIPLMPLVDAGLIPAVAPMLP